MPEHCDLHSVVLYVLEASIYYCEFPGLHWLHNVRMHVTLSLPCASNAVCHKFLCCQERLLKELSVDFLIHRC